MKTTHKLAPLPEIPAKRYFAIGEVSDLCGVKAHVLRYWEQEFPQLKPAKRRGNRRYYQQGDVEMVRRIRSLLYEQGYTIGAARMRLKDAPDAEPVALPTAPADGGSRQQQLRDIRLELQSLLDRWPY
ncbi:MAG: MerR family transcriptional regulator [Nevskia sp.]|jgi:DNA-binding transcriptional MerR regulator|uniref:MerR family transcriptional regulator n=1 Tax=Nevskia sp. TaxID=1929292 RepID=UPI004035B1FB